MDKNIKERWEDIDQDLVPKGYKKTKVGIIPEGWDVYSIKDFSKIDNKKYYPKKDQKIFKCIELEHIEKETGELLGFTNTDNVKSTKNMFLPGDVLYGKLRPYLKKYYYTKFKGVCSTEIWVLKNIAQKITAEYLYLIVQTPKWNYLANISIGSSMPRADWEYMESGLFPIPSLEEQEGIADILSAWDRAIESYSKLLEEKKKRKKGLMQILLTGEERLGGFTGPWKEVKLGEIGEFKTSSVDKKIRKNEHHINLLNYMDVYNNNTICKEVKFAKSTANNSQLQVSDVLKGDIFFTPSSETREDIGRSSVVLDNIDNLLYSYHLIRFRLYKNFDMDLIFRAYCFNNIEIYKQFYSLATGSTRYTLSIKDFNEIKIRIPELEEQKAIADVLSTADREIDLIEKLIEELKEEKKGLMQLLLKGIVRV